MSSLNEKLLKLIHLGNNILSTESKVHILIRESCTAIDRISTVWTSKLSGKIKGEFSLAVYTNVWLHHLDLNEILPSRLGL